MKQALQICFGEEQMGRPIVPELHDVGKLFQIEAELARELDLEAGSVHSPNKMRLLPAKLGIPEPCTSTWRGIVGHHVERGATPPTDLDVVLLIVADHAGASFARARELDALEPCHRTVHKLWNPGDQRDLHLPGSRAVLRSLIEWLSTDPDQQAFFAEYGPLLDVRPEELRPPLNVTSLASHLTIVGKLYRFLTARQEFYAKTMVVKDIEARPVDLVKAKIGFPQQIVRTRDMTLFRMMAQEIQQLARDDRVLVATFDQILAILGPYDPVEDLMSPLVDAGFNVIWERARTQIGRLGSTPKRIRKDRHLQLRKGSQDVPPDRRADWIWEKLDQDYTMGTLPAPKVDRLPPPICDVCQMEPATKLWPEAPEAPGPRENIGERCYELRRNASRLFKLDRWTEEPSARVAWVYVELDLDRLVEFLGPLYREYARNAGLSPELVSEVDVRPPLIAEFQKDCRKFLADFAASVEEWIGADNLERVGDEAGGAANALLCVRLASVVQVPELLTRYLECVRRYFPVMLERFTAIDTIRVQPFRLAVSVSGAKFPFSEHWRIMQEDSADVLINVIGRRAVRAPLGSLPILIEAGQSSRRAALHNLAEVAKVSEALAEAYVQNKGEKHFGEYQALLSRMQPLGMTYESLVAYANLLEG